VSEFILELKGVTKDFPGVRALDDVHFNVREGEVHSIIGENGAGKSTFIKIITGVYTPDAGEIIFNGEPAVIRNTLDSQRLGIAAIYQHVTSYPDLSVTENIFIGHEKYNPYTRRIAWKELHARAAELLGQLEASFDPRVRMGSLSVAQQQIVEIAKALSVNARVIIMDEPTAALTNRESEELYTITENLKRKGAAVIFISHRMEDMFRLADRVTVFRDAKYIDTWDRDEITREKLVRAMVGREITQYFPKRDVHIREEVLRVEHISRQGYFRDVSLTLHRGEILAVTGLVGAGRTEVCEALYGITNYDEGHVFLDGEEIHIRHPKEAIEKGIGYLPEDRHGHGLVMDWELFKNVSLASLEKFSRWKFIQEDEEKKSAQELGDKLEIKAGSVFDKANTLSGGNQQKVIVAKLLTADLKVIILDEPTKGVDVGAKTAIFNIMGELAEMGYGILMVSSEMPEVLGVSDRIVVMKEGRVSAVLKTQETTQEEILHAALGETRKAVSHAE